MTVQSGYSNNSNSIPEEILYPSLKQVGGTLEIVPRASDRWGSYSYEGNDKWTNLDFLANLESIGGFKITNHTNLSSYEGLKKAIATCPESKWEVTDNLYNPTYEQAKAGQLVKP
jgi:hypothetical protein